MLTLCEFREDQNANVAIITALTLPMLLIAMLGGTTVMKALHDRRELEDLAQSACNVAVKPLRMINMADEQRRQSAETLFDRLANERGFNVTSRTVTAGWLVSTVQASATVETVPGWGTQLAIPISVSQTCRGIPPYPKLGEVILSSNFKTPSGTSIELIEQRGMGQFTPKQVTWDSFTGSGIEIQTWLYGFNLMGVGKEYLPAGTKSPFVVELDSGARPSPPCHQGQPAARKRQGSTAR